MRRACSIILATLILSISVQDVLTEWLFEYQLATIIDQNDWEYLPTPALECATQCLLQQAIADQNNETLPIGAEKELQQVQFIVLEQDGFQKYNTIDNRSATLHFYKAWFGADYSNHTYPPPKFS